MTDKQQQTLPGPMFEPGPGWGQKLGRWFRRNWSIKILPAFAVLVLLAGIAKVYSQPRIEEATDQKEIPPPSPFPRNTLLLPSTKETALLPLAAVLLASTFEIFQRSSLNPRSACMLKTFLRTNSKGQL